MLSPKMEKALLQTSRDAWASFHALALPEDAMLCIAETFRPLIADLEAKAQTARAEALEGCYVVVCRSTTCGEGELRSTRIRPGRTYVVAERALASTDPTGEKI